ncbi:XRE family transcriptional regulator [Kribbella capetownensis]|uniref:XRE family transcriptional regulator n=1 Tax=Kribbella capetownensis TaxID=1572659 RepID=A0A4R0IRA4_9ACTN|nr:helix-turn-helix domain-containing protein [Kribbella capetownensis]TCC33858.1 XRE family transcriptional regulator [Kribbella capetownensis]
MSTVVTTWTGAKARALRTALRLTIDEMAERLGSSPRGIAKWDSQPDLHPGVASQRDLDVLLGAATEAEQARFALLLKDLGDTGSAKATDQGVVVGGEGWVPSDQQGEDLAGIGARRPSASVLADPIQITVQAAAASFEFLAWAEDQLPGAVVDYVMSELQRLATAYVHQPALPIFVDLVQLRDVTFRLLKNRPHPRQSRTLFFTAGSVCTLLAHASQNLGNSSAARTQAATAWACAEQADHAGLRAWVRGTQALIAEWTDSYAQAVSFSQDGQRYASGEQLVRLAAIEGRSLARTGDAEGAIDAVARATQARDAVDGPDELGELGGILTFPEAKQLYYAGSTLSLVGRHADAEKAARDAISLYVAGSPADRSYGDEALARVDVAAARLADDDLDGVRESLAPVLALPANQRIRQIGDGLSRVQQVLARPRYVRAAPGMELAESIAGFSATDAFPHLR